MFNFNTITIFVLIATFASSSIQAVYFYGQLLQKNGIRIVLLGDYHRDHSGSLHTTKQANDLVEIAQRYNAHVLVEDVDSPDGANDQIYATSSMLDFLKPHSNKLRNGREEARLKRSKSSLVVDSPMAGFYDLCTKNGILVTNLECRFMMRYGNKLTAMAEIEAVLSRVKKCELSSDTSAFKVYIDNFEKIFNSHKSLGFYAKFIDKLFLGEEWLRTNRIANSVFDLNMFCDLYEAINKGEKKVLIVCAGCVHTAIISKMLIDILKCEEVIAPPSFYRSWMGSYDYGYGEVEYMRKCINLPLNIPEFFNNLSRQPTILSKL